MVTITTRELLQLVHLVHAKSSITIPNEVLEVLKDVVSGR